MTTEPLASDVRDTRVCSRCGELAGEQRFCPSCGLNLAEQPELPTAEEYSAKERERGWLAQQASPADTFERDDPDASRISDVPVAEPSPAVPLMSSTEGAGPRGIQELSTTSPPTLGNALGQMTLDRAAMLGGGVLVAIGSVGPWATSPLVSVSGTSGDGVITLIAAIVLGIVAMLPNKHVFLASLAVLVAGGVGIYDLIHISHTLQSATLGGVQIDHVGWGLYVVVVGAVIALAGLLKMRGRPATLLPAES